MECVIAFAVVVGVLAILVILGTKRHVQFGQGHAYSVLAKKYHGSYIRGGLFRTAHVRFRYGREDFMVWSSTMEGVHRQDVTQIEVDWPDIHFQCEVHTRGFPVASTIPQIQHDELTQRLGESFIVRSNDAARAIKLLSEGVQWELTKLKAIRGDHQIHLYLNQGRLRIIKLTRLNRIEYLDEFTLIALELYDQAMLTRSEGIEFVGGTAAQLIDEARCQICGDDIVSDMVFCRRCKTPHHAECWQYNGSCAIFGCQETRYAVPMVANPTSEQNVDKEAAD